MSLPVVKVTMPPDLVNALNGRLLPELLTPVSFPGRGTGRLHLQAARAWWAFQHDAQVATGCTLTVTSTGDAYRDFEHQLSGFLTRMEPVSAAVYLVTSSKRRRRFVFGGHTYWRLKAGYAPISTPGESNHGWGLALDVCVLLANGTLQNIAASSAWPWVKANLARYGMTWEYTDEGTEPWHVRLVVGIFATAAVLAFEAGSPTSPLPPFDPARQLWGLWPIAVKPRIGLGAKGDPVRYLQGVLNMLYGGVAVDGSFGKQTDTALRRFQTERHLAIDGWAGSSTWPVIDAATVKFDPAAGKFGDYPTRSKPTIRKGSGEDQLVSYAQGVILHRAGGDIVVDGSYGSGTARRVADVQRIFGLPENGDVIDGATWNALDTLGKR